LLFRSEQVDAVKMIIVESGTEGIILYAGEFVCNAKLTVAEEDCCQSFAAAELAANCTVFNAF